MMVHKREKLFGTLKKGTFFSKEVTFLPYIVAAEGIKADESKIEPFRHGQPQRAYIMCGVFMGSRLFISSS